MAPAASVDGLVDYIHANLDQELALVVLAERVGVSPFHLHRRFKACTGQTPAKYVERVRLERAADALVLHDLTVLSVALDHGYSVVETFIRSFRRRFGMTPSGYRARGRLQGVQALPDRRSVASPFGTFEISRTRIVKMRPTYVACCRHIGAYETVPDELWANAAGWAKARKLKGHRFVGIGHDQPGPQARFDAGLIVDRPFEGDEEVSCWEIPREPFAVASHVGPYVTLTAAMPRIYQQALELPDCTVIGLPVIELYHAAEIVSNRGIEQTDVYIPIAPT